jgi:diadenosine tetraphosphatase ApaH/serine/threonine PP2A family protein phosphatase
MKRDRHDQPLADDSGSQPLSTSAGGSSGDAFDDGAIEAAIHTVLGNWRNATVRSPFTEPLVRTILHRSREQLLSEPTLVQVDAPVNICGDLHGQIHDLVNIFQAGKLPPTGRYLFLGDYVDRGKYGIECICVLLGLKLLHPNHIYILRGNHETPTVNRMYGFFDECKRRGMLKLYKVFCDVFDCLPLAALVEGAVLCMHGGLSQQLQSLEQIANIKRPLSVPDHGIIADLLWADPDHHPGFRMSSRGVSYTFGPDVVKRTLRELDLELVVRAHEVQQTGFGFFADRGLVTVFSASNYCGEFENASAMLQMDATLKCSFQTFLPTTASGNPPASLKDQ